MSINLFLRYSAEGDPCTAQVRAQIIVNGSIFRQSKSFNRRWNSGGNYFIGTIHPSICMYLPIERLLSLPDHQHIYRILFKNDNYHIIRCLDRLESNFIESCLNFQITLYTYLVLLSVNLLLTYIIGIGRQITTILDLDMLKFRIFYEYIISLVYLH